MKARSRRTTAAYIPNSRWLAYAGAGAATALAGTNSVDAEIHYSGRLDVYFGPDSNMSQTFPLGEAGGYILLSHDPLGRPKAYFEIEGLRSEAFLGYSVFEYGRPARLPRANHYLSEATRWVTFYNFGTLYSAANGYGKWGRESTGFVGFRFDNGAGIQYGWARIHMIGDNAGFIFRDYAYGDPGDPVRPGQTSLSPKNEKPQKGSLGLLALGGAGLALWRRPRCLAR